MSEECDVAVVGAGAAGLTAAAFASAAAPEARVVALDGAPKIGAKILISGGGRCNVTNAVVRPDDFNGSRNAIAKVLRSFTVGETVAWFESLGVPLVEEDRGKLFPRSNRARSVVDALLRACATVDVRNSHRVASIERTGPAFLLRFSDPAHQPLSARRVILATGGRSVPKTGSDGQGFSFARQLGHTVTPLFPALVPLVAEPGHWSAALSGTSCEAALTAQSGTGARLAVVRGSFLFTHFGFSGPAVLDASRHWLAAREGGDVAAQIRVNFVGEPGELIEKLLVDVRGGARATVAGALRGRLPERLLDALLAVAGLANGMALSQLTRESRRELVRLLTEMPLPLTGSRGFDYAEVTAGGVPLDEITIATMESRAAPGLHLCGEILDVDGRIGGFNFQWAWASGRAAGFGAARALRMLAR